MKTLRKRLYAKQLGAKYARLYTKEGDAFYIVHDREDGIANCSIYGYNSVENFKRAVQEVCESRKHNKELEKFFKSLAIEEENK